MSMNGGSSKKPGIFPTVGGAIGVVLALLLIALVAAVSVAIVIDVFGSVCGWIGCLDH